MLDLRRLFDERGADMARIAPTWKGPLPEPSMPLRKWSER
jgi:hypothetical protein